MKSNKYKFKDDVIRIDNVEWKILVEKGKYYLVSKDGRVARYNDYLTDGEIVLYKPRISNRGYVLIDDKLAHRLVAKAWLPNPYMLSTIDHIDANKENNNISNLQWLSRSANARKAVYTENKKMGKKPTPVIINGEWYLSQNEAARIFGVNVGSISYQVKKQGSNKIQYERAK